MRLLAGTDLALLERIPRYVVGFGAAMTVALIAEIGLYVALGIAIVFSGEFLVGVVTTIPSTVGIAFGGHWLCSSDLSPARYPRVVG